MKSKVPLRLIYCFLISYLLFACQEKTQTSSVDIKTESYEQFRKLGYHKIIEEDPLRIQIYKQNPRYWQYKGEPVLLLGASDEDNLFNHPDIWPYGLESHLDLMVHNGGNYVRNTMSSRDQGNLWPFGKNNEGKYDLTTWNEKYWDRFKTFLELTYERDIIVQIELWDRFDFARDPWSQNPFNPKNNVNYNSGRSGLPEVIDTHPGQKENPFFRTPLDSINNSLLLGFQEAFINKILSISLEYPNILYCISNETNESPVWSDYWAYHVLKYAMEKNVLVHITEMWDPWDLSDPMHKATFEKPDLYTYVDISQNNHQQGQTHWDNAQLIRNETLKEKPRPMNSVKIYGGLRHGGSIEEGTHRFWRNIFGGFASSRFHRRSDLFNPSGIGLSPLAQTQIRSMRLLVNEIDIFKSAPANNLLKDRGKNEAYAMAVPDSQYAVYFPKGDSVLIDLSSVSDSMTVQWLEILTSEWKGKYTIQAGRPVELIPPGNTPWAVILKTKSAS